MIGEHREAELSASSQSADSAFDPLYIRPSGHHLTGRFCYDWSMGTTHRDNPDRPGFLRVPMRYPNEYVWLVFISMVDLIATWIILKRRGGYEINPLADLVITRFGSTGLVLFKVAIFLFVIFVCEIVGRKSDSRGRWLARVGVGISAIPLVVSLFFVLRSMAVYFSSG